MSSSVPALCSRQTTLTAIGAGAFKAGIYSFLATAVCGTMEDSQPFPEGKTKLEFHCKQ